MVNHAKGKSRTLSEADTTISDTVEEKPCIKCQEPFEPPYKALQCDKCASWVHSGCTELNDDQYKFLTKKTLSSAIKWFCPVCEAKVSDASSRCDEKKVDSDDKRFDKLADIVLKIAEQNAEILQNMKRDMMVEEKLKVNVREILDNRKDAEDRGKNMICFNVPEGDKSEDDDEEGELERDDRQLVTQICNFVYTEPGQLPTFEEGDLSFERLGPKRKPTAENPSPKPRPIKVFFKDVATKDKILRNAKKLKGSIFSYVGLSADKSKEEREADYAKRMELRRRKLAGEDVILFRGEVCLRSDQPWLKRTTATLEGNPSKVASPSQ